MDDRIKLAEAMGWTNSHQYRWDGPRDDGEYRNDPPDPFTDANDDYAVLEWMRSSGNAAKFEFHLCMALNDDPVRYAIGDYARAAISVLDRQSS